MSTLFESVDIVAPSIALEQKDNQASSLPGETKPSETPGWWWDAQTPGTGQRPDFLNEKYKTVADQAKAQRDLEKRYGATPDKYDFTKGNSWIEEDYEPFQAMAEVAKQHHVPQEVMDSFLETVGSYLNEFQTDLSEEKAKLGEKAGERIQVLNNWAKSNLSEKSFQVLSGNMRTAEAIEALEELRSKMVSSSSMIPNDNSAVSANGQSLEEYRSELNSNYSKYKSDPAYRKQMEQKLKLIIKE